LLLPAPYRPSAAGRRNRPGRDWVRFPGMKRSCYFRSTISIRFGCRWRRPDGKLELISINRRRLSPSLM